MPGPGPVTGMVYLYIYIFIFFLYIYCQIIVEKIANRTVHALVICKDTEAHEAVFNLLWSGWSGTVKGVNAIFPSSIRSGQMVMVYLS